MRTLFRGTQLVAGFYLALFAIPFFGAFAVAGDSIIFAFIAVPQLLIGVGTYLQIIRRKELGFVMLFAGLLCNLFLQFMMLWILVGSDWGLYQALYLSHIAASVITFVTAFANMIFEAGRDQVV